MNTLHTHYIYDIDIAHTNDKQMLMKKIENVAEKKLASQEPVNGDHRRHCVAEDKGHAQAYAPTERRERAHGPTHSDVDAGHKRTWREGGTGRGREGGKKQVNMYLIYRYHVY